MASKGRRCARTGTGQGDTNHDNAALQRILNNEEPMAIASQGLFCGNSCRVKGAVCGFNCVPLAQATNVIDPEGRLGITEQELADIKQNFPELRRAVAHKVEVELNKLR